LQHYKKARTRSSASSGGAGDGSSLDGVHELDEPVDAAPCENASSSEDDVGALDDDGLVTDIAKYIGEGDPVGRSARSIWGSPRGTQNSSSGLQSNGYVHYRTGHSKEQKRSS